MTYPLLAYVNRRNAAELARVVNLSAAELVRVESLEWAPPTEEVRTRSGRSLGRGDKIRCGESIDGDIADFGSQRGRSYKRESWNVCRPFDEAHAANIAAGHDGEYAYPSIRVLAEEFDGEDVVKQENFLARLITPPNHGHGAVCGCVEKTWFGQPHDGVDEAKKVCSFQIDDAGIDDLIEALQAIKRMQQRWANRRLPEI